MILTLLFSFALTSHAQLARPVGEIVWDVKAKAWISPQQMAEAAKPGEILVLGEQHATADNEKDLSVRIHHGNQLRLLDLLAAARLRPSLGMEFFPYTSQAAVDRYLLGRLPENAFLSQIGFGNAFSLYRDQVHLPRLKGGDTVGLNIPRRVSRKVSKHGPHSLTSVEWSWLPPLWEKGSMTYWERFLEAMEGHVSLGQIENMFWTQSLWDDTMAWRAQTYLRANPLTTLVILVGEFHVQFNDGLAARLKKHGAKQVKTVLQEEVDSLDLNKLSDLTKPDPKYGARADYLWFWLKNSAGQEEVGDAKINDQTRDVDHGRDQRRRSGRGIKPELSEYER